MLYRVDVFKCAQGSNAPETVLQKEFTDFDDAAEFYKNLDIDNIKKTFQNKYTITANLQIFEKSLLNKNILYPDGFQTIAYKYI